MVPFKKGDQVVYKDGQNMAFCDYKTVDYCFRRNRDWYVEYVEGGHDLVRVLKLRPKEGSMKSTTKKLPFQAGDKVCYKDGQQPRDKDFNDVDYRVVKTCEADCEELLIVSYVDGGWDYAEFLCIYEDPTEKFHKHHDLIVAWAEGAKIEFQNPDKSWSRCERPAWDPSTNYRIVEGNALKIEKLRGKIAEIEEEIAKLEASS